MFDTRGGNVLASNSLVLYTHEKTRNSKREAQL
jgi:hypothetical protein